MASHSSCCTFLLPVLLSALFQITLCQINSYFTYKELSSCKDGTNENDAYEFFNPNTFLCVKCAQNSLIQKRSANGLSCECMPGYRYTKNFGGNEVNCTLCPDAVSDDGWECVTCPGRINEMKKCDPCLGSNDISVLRELNGGYVSSTSPAVTCQTCNAVTQPTDEKNRCERCSITLSLSASSTCTCDASTEKKLNGVCVLLANTIVNPSASLFLIPLENDETGVTSSYLQDNLEAAYTFCRYYKNITACQSLANMCVLIMYRGGRVQTVTTQPQACFYFLQLENSPFYDYKPQIYVEQDADNEIYSEQLRIQWTVDPIMKFPFLVGQFSLEGTFEGFQEMTGSFLQLCQAEEKVLNSAFVFGTYYKHTCSISALTLWDQVKYPLKFYEIYLKYTDTTQNPAVENLYRIPLKVLNFRDSRNEKANQGPIRDWQLTRRFFLVDSVTTQRSEDLTVSVCAQKGATYVRFAKDIHLHVELQSDSADGYTYIPYFDITYDDVPRQTACDGKTVDVSFQVSYTMSQSTYTRNFQIATGTLSALGLLYAGFRTYVWSRRAGRISIDFPTLANFIFFLCGSLSNCFFVIIYGVAFYFFIFYKRQNVIYIVHPEGQAYEDWIALFGAAFALKALALIHMIIMQCSVDIFMVDWERPKGTGGSSGDAGKKQPSTVSIWRTYFVANEWNEIQTKRKINQVFQIFSVVFFLVVVGFEDTATKDPDGSVNKGADVYMSEQSAMYRMALAATIYLVIGIVQIIFFLFIYERFITDDIREFVDICSMSNISVFVMAHGEFGYYIHGRSVHGCSDVAMDEMSDMIKREEADLVGQRGLVSGTEAQTFMMAIPKRLREKYTAVYMPVQLENATSRMGKSQTGKEKSIEAYMTLNRFFCAFIDHSLRDIDYVVKDKNLLEKLLDTEFLELTDKGIFYSDNGHSFDNVLFYGNELMLLIFDVLLFCIVDLIFMDFVLAGIITYLIIELICLIRDTAGKKNLARKTLVDERFLI
ncbi:unnamed protein product [Lymnaea stagnalis]|uniref:Meckelin n=1 Tax=Lymnaea stagnalis TaxID=6523 RepID=A0AAV2HMI8_LYMST